MPSPEFCGPAPAGSGEFMIRTAVSGWPVFATLRLALHSCKAARKAGPSCRFGK